MEGELLTIQEVGEMLKISRSKAYSLLKENGFPAIRIGKSIRVIKKELLNWLTIYRKRYIMYADLKAGRGNFERLHKTKK